jgi:diacylglycerol kinase (ATP)
MSARLHVVLNPSAGGGRAHRIRAEVERELSAAAYEFEITETAASGDAVGIARRAAGAGASVLLAVGGDGTIHEVANGLLRALDEQPDLPAVLAVIPVGTGNDFTKMLDARPGRPAAYERLRTGERRRIDVGLATWNGEREYFVNAFGTGIDTQVVRAIQPLRRLPRPLVYLVGLSRALAGYVPARIRVTLADERIERSIMTLAVANGSCIGGSFRICPDARPDDGLLDLCLVDQLPLLRQPAMAIRILRGTHTAHPAVLQRRSDRVVIGAVGGGPLEFQLDGEPRDLAAGDITLEVRPAALPVLVPAGSNVGRPGRWSTNQPAPRENRV